MTDYNELKKALLAGDAAFENAFTPEVCAKLIAHIAELEQRVAELEPEAKRYQYLRSVKSIGDGPFVAIYSGSFSMWNGEVCDHIIDLTIAKSSGKEPT